MPPTRTAARWWVYLLLCGDGSLYCGITNDLEKRFEMHARGKGARYTRGRGPLRVVHRERCKDRPAALRREHAIKQLSRAEKDRLIAGGRRKPKARPADGPRKGSAAASAERVARSP